MEFSISAANEVVRDGVVVGKHETISAAAEQVAALRVWEMLPESIKSRDFSTQQREDLAKKGHALPDGSYPIVTERDLQNAIQAYGRAKNKARVKRHIIKRARALGRTDLLPEDWT